MRACTLILLFLLATAVVNARPSWSDHSDDDGSDDDDLKRFVKSGYNVGSSGSGGGSSSSSAALPPLPPPTSGKGRKVSEQGLARMRAAQRYRFAVNKDDPTEKERRRKAGENLSLFHQKKKSG